MIGSKLCSLPLLALVLSACGFSPFVEPKANPVIEDRSGAFSTLATTGERRIAFVRTKSLVSSPLDATQSARAVTELANRDKLINVATVPGSNGHEFFAGRLVGRFGGKEGEFCAEPSPDAIESIATAFGAAFEASKTLPTNEALAVQAGISKTLSTASGALFRRTQGIQLYRDGAFFLCQAVMNGYIDAAEYQEALFKLRGDAVGLVEAEFETSTWNSDPKVDSIPAPTAPPAPVLPITGGDGGGSS